MFEWPRIGCMIVAVLLFCSMVHAAIKVSVVEGSEPFDTGKNWSVTVKVTDDAEPVPLARVEVELNALPPISYLTDARGVVHFAYSPNVGDEMTVRVLVQGKQYGTYTYNTETTGLVALIDKASPYLAWMAITLAMLAFMLLAYRKFENRITEQMQKIVPVIQERVHRSAGWIELQARAMGPKHPDLRDHVKKKKIVKQDRTSLLKYQEKKIEMRKEFMRKFEG